MEHIFRKFRQLAGTAHGITIDHIWRENFFVAMFAGMEIKEEIDHRTLQPGPQSFIDGETGAGDLSRTFEIENIEIDADIPVI